MDDLLTKLAILGGILSPFLSVLGVIVSRIIDAKKENKELEIEKEASESAIKEQEARVRKLSIETSLAQLEHVNKIIDDLREEVEQYKTRTLDLESKLEKSNARISELESNLSNSDTRIGELQTRLTQSNTRNSILTDENDKLRKQMEFQKKENIALRKQIESQQVEIDELKLKIEILEQKKA
jgi:chromosome segregation ATPase